MRTRSSNKSKRFSVQEYDYGISSDDEAPPKPSKGRGESDDENFENGGGADDLGDDEHQSGDDEDAEEEEQDDDDHDVLEVVESSNAKAAAAATRGPSNRPKPGPQAAATGDYHEIPPLPKDPRTSRVWDGPLKKWDRFALLTDLLYGPNWDHIRLINRLRNRWRRNPVLPTRGHRDDGGVAAPSWQPEGFEKLQAERFQSWYQGLYLKVTTSIQRSHPLPAKTRSQLLPQPDGDLIALLGPAGRQQSIKFNMGKTISLQEFGGLLDPSEPAEKHSAGWMLDVGGIPLAAGWAPIAGKTDQLLALAVVPFADQADQPAPTEKAEAPPSPDESMRVGCVQLWRFPISEDSTGVIRPSRDPPRLASVLSFDWGRPKRLQWCPVPLPAGSATYGLLAVLAGDGMVRILDVRKRAGSDENDVYGARFLSLINLSLSRSLPPPALDASVLTYEQNGSKRPSPLWASLTNTMSTQPAQHGSTSTVSYWAIPTVASACGRSGPVVSCNAMSYTPTTSWTCARRTPRTRTPSPPTP